MGNFQRLAETVLNKRVCIKQVSNFPLLREETGNLCPSNRNFTGNSNNSENQIYTKNQAVKVETAEETNRKPFEKSLETFDLVNTPQSFLMAMNMVTLLPEFFEKAKSFGIELLNDDKNWLKDICYGESLKRTKSLLSEYIDRWDNAANQETIPHKKQNAGRYKANSFIRQAIINKN